MSAPSDESETGGSPACDAGLTAARERALYAIRALMEADPEGWPEHLASVASIACEQDCRSLDLLADASVQMAAKAHKQRHEGVGAIADEFIFAGAYDLSGRKHGAWVRQSRFETIWKEETEWYIHGELVTREIQEQR